MHSGTKYSIEIQKLNFFDPDSDLISVTLMIPDALNETGANTSYTSNSWINFDNDILRVYGQAPPVNNLR